MPNPWAAIKTAVKLGGSKSGGDAEEDTNAEAYPVDPRTNLPIVGVPKRYKGKYPLLEECVIHHFEIVKKINQRGKQQDRLLIITDDTVYSAEVSGAVRRCILIANIDKILMSPDKSMALTCPSDYDYLFKCQSPMIVSNILSTIHKFHTGSPLEITSVDDDKKLNDLVNTRRPPGWEMEFHKPTTKENLAEKLDEIQPDSPSEQEGLDAFGRKPIDKLPTKEAGSRDRFPAISPNTSPRSQLDAFGRAPIDQLPTKEAGSRIRKFNTPRAAEDEEQHEVTITKGGRPIETGPGTPRGPAAAEPASAPASGALLSPGDATRARAPSNGATPEIAITKSTDPVSPTAMSPTRPRSPSTSAFRSAAGPPRLDYIMDDAQQEALMLALQKAIERADANEQRLQEIKAKEREMMRALEEKIQQAETQVRQNEAEIRRVQREKEIEIQEQMLRWRREKEEKAKEARRRAQEDEEIAKQRERERQSWERQRYQERMVLEQLLKRLEETQNKAEAAEAELRELQRVAAEQTEDLQRRKVLAAKCRKEEQEQLRLQTEALKQQQEEDRQRRHAEERERFAVLEEKERMRYHTEAEMELQLLVANWRLDQSAQELADEKLQMEERARAEQERRAIEDQQRKKEKERRRREEEERFFQRARQEWEEKTRQAEAKKLEQERMSVAGYLLKSSGVFASWQRRWHVLEDGCMSYQTEYGKRVALFDTADIDKVAVDFQYDSAQVVPPPGSEYQRRCNFYVRTNKGKTYHFCAESKEPRDAWVTALRLWQESTARPRGTSGLTPRAPLSSLDGTRERPFSATLEGQSLQELARATPLAGTLPAPPSLLDGMSSRAREVFAQLTDPTFDRQRHPAGSVARRQQTPTTATDSRRVASPSAAKNRSTSQPRKPAPPTALSSHSTNISSARAPLSARRELSRSPVRAQARGLEPPPYSVKRGYYYDPVPRGS
eukprot:TRINITY_DN10589_c0_g1_i1.p1 TRINITY_DN10589_c0_g1~~TRINITY_DN10589_c0_g1_i1.p1  ORF type:complete len:967 (+),score=147.87 TRINITY_DN10589_c0_g1_i1:40-2901(+)